MRTARTLTSLALAGAVALGAVACGDDTDPTGESGTEPMTEEMDEEMTEEMTEEMDDGEG